jgi:hypothetical protein
MPCGNTLFPVWQRLFLAAWKRVFKLVCYIRKREKYTPRWIFCNLTAKEMGEAISELTRRPSLYFTHIFSKKQTVYLLLMWLVLTGIDYLMFIPDYNTSAFVGGRNQWIQALFQTVTVRTTGFTIMDLSQVQLGHISYWIMAMYLSSYPFMISEKTAKKLSVGLFEEQDDDEDHPFPERTTEDETSIAPVAASVDDAGEHTNHDSQSVTTAGGGVRSMLQKIKSSAGNTVATEIGWLYLCCIVIVYAEGQSITDSGTDSSPFARILFEISSAYGTVGLSLSSASASSVSYSAVLSPLSQVVIVVLMYFGKFRGLPQTIELDAVQHLLEYRRRTGYSQLRRRLSGMGHMHDSHHISDLQPTRAVSFLPNGHDESYGCPQMSDSSVMAPEEGLTENNGDSNCSRNEPIEPSVRPSDD